MTAPRGGRWSLPVKVTLLAALVQLAVGLAIAALTGVGDDGRVVAALAAILAVPVAVVYAITRFLVGRLTAPVIAAYQRLAAGDFSAELPSATAGRDFLGLREGFRAMAEALERTLAEVRGADRERRRLFADLAHELATPTTTLMGIAAAVQSGAGDQARLLALLDRECARLERLIGDVRELATLEDPALRLEFEACDVGALVTAAVDGLRVGGPALAAVRVTAPALTAEVDPARVEQIVANLVTNAARHAGGAAVEVAARRDGDHLTLTVDDAGPGVPEDRLAELGRRLLRVERARDRASGGHGLGLSIVRAIVARHGGVISFARSRLGGLGVVVRLPLVAATRGPPPAAPG
ncbi:MAG: HAMP domain-containing histidine kinase [Myxococcales bacterium]|nr:HAMP domain-containing histidine kinase [Myxococcales bacterium]